MYALLGRLVSGLNVCASLLTLAIAVSIGADVLGRVLFRHPLYGIPEITKLSIVAIVWLQMAYTLHVRKHLRSDTLLGAFPSGWRRGVMLVNAGAGAFVFGVIAYYGWPALTSAWLNGVFEGEEPVRIPVWPVWAVLVGGAGLTAIEYGAQALQALGIGEYRDDAGPAD
ncbi:MAG: TRAP transporter small permease [Candidatus Eiseniibacteriota bacterium]